eukprot:GFUD01018374.1.p1 GENE.GFUD01018374.1~~GFUD01018374.1.p1  ORF type:complete len:518 (-),score=181.81 GFUD01018374.1:190-1743(-)
MPGAVEVERPNFRNCVVNVLKLQEAKGDYKTSDISKASSTPAKLTKEKALLLPKKKSTKSKPLTTKTLKGKKDGKVQIKISGFFTPKRASKTDEDTEEEDNKAIVEGDTEGRKRTASGESDDRPDSGFASRADTPAVWSEAGSKAGSPLKEGDVVDEVGKDKQKFLNEVEKESEKAEASEKEEEESEKEQSSSSEEESESDWDGDSDDGFKKAAKKPAPKKKVKGKVARARAAMNQPIIIPGAMKSELSAYEKIRDDNIKEREAMLAALMADFQDYKKDIGLGEKKPAQKRKRRLDDDGSAFRSSAGLPTERRKSARLADQPEGGDRPLGSQVWDAGTKEYKEYKLAEEASDYDEEDYQNHEVMVKKRTNTSRCAIDPNEGVLMPEDITPSMLKKVADRFGSKKYNQSIGTTCHQCRQKTVDMKTICRSGECVGVRGQFCGRCLTIRYGEDAREALMDANWKCPPCRNFCNCSICRNRNGKGATGILIQLSQSKGYDNVADYLKALTKKKGTDEFDD